MKIAALALILLLPSPQTPNDGYSGKPEQIPMTLEQVQPIVQKYVNEWSKNHPEIPLWVSLANPGDPISVPGITFSTAGNPKAGMELPIHAHLIVINKIMIPESILATFSHEYGHALYRQAHPHDFQEIDSEVAAIKSSMMILPSEGFEYLAYREAQAFKDMASAEPYRSAVERLAADPLWKKYSPKPQN